MSRSCFVYAKIGDTPLPNINSFEFHDSTDKDDMIELKLSPVTLDFIDSEIIVEGAIVEVTWGYLQGKQRTIKMTLKDVQPKFSGALGLVLKAYDSGPDMKVSESAKIYDKVTTTDIAGDIAKRHGLTLNAPVLSKVWSNTPQGNKGDFEFLSDLVSKEEGGNYIVFVKEKTLFIKTRDLDKLPAKTFVYGINIISFDPELKTSEQHHKKKGSVETSVIGYDMLAKSSVESKAGSSVKNEKNLGKNVYSYDKDANLVGSAIATGQKIVTGSGDPDENANQAKNNALTAQLNNIEAKLEVEGDPTYRADENYTISGVGKKFGGNFYAEGVKHKITNGRYTCGFDLKKDASDGNLSKSNISDNPNNKKGPDNNQDKNKVYKYDGDGKPAKTAINDLIANNQ